MLLFPIIACHKIKIKYIYKELWKRMKEKSLNPTPSFEFAKFSVRVLVLK
jgi:hypothetical protein